LSKKTSIRFKIILLIVFFSLVPVSFITGFIIVRSYIHLKEKTVDFYSNLLEQVTVNIDFVYDQYRITLNNSLNTPLIVKGLNDPPYTSVAEEYNHTVVMTSEKGGGFRDTVEEKIEGVVAVVELDRKSLLFNQDYKVHYISPGSKVFSVEELIKDPIYKKLQSNTSIEMIFGKFQPGVVSSSFGDEYTVMIYPWYPDNGDKPKKPFTKFMVVLFFSDFMPKFYDEISQMQYGTLYILDQFDNILSYNHPNPDDYYDFDDESGRYVLGDDDPNDPFEPLSFKDYTALNVDQKILEKPKVKSVTSIIDKSSSGYHNHVISFNRRNYLMITRFAPQSKMKLVYFQPLAHVYKPVYDIVRAVGIYTFVLIIIVIFISIFLSNSFTVPIKKLITTTKNISIGNYNELVEVKTGDEFHTLSDNFNVMVREIKSYQDQLVSVERQKAEIDLAQKIQTSLLPPIPECDYYEMTANMMPTPEVGGDYLDFMKINSKGQIWLSIGDVSGFGLAAGLVMMMAQTSCNTLLLNNPDITLDDMIMRVNRVLYKNITEHLAEENYMTMTSLRTYSNGEIHYFGTHHDMLLFRSKTGKVERIGTKSIELGIRPDIDPGLTVQRFTMHSGDLLFIYTGGLTRAKNRNNEEYGVVRLIEKLEKHAAETLQSMDETIIQDVFDFIEHQQDDISFISLRKK
jgi:serine phosphatase RsbU (regulator of sigma subunit)